MIIFGFVLLIIGALLVVWYLLKKVILTPAEFKNGVMFDGPFGNIIERDTSTGLATYIKDSYGNESWFKYDKFGRIVEYKDSTTHQLYAYRNGTRMVAPFDPKKASL